ncbi:MAG: protein DpdG, partial [Planctomycetota bacterium]|nr:protein DpdG [Planctomycetota bacterium]
MSILNRPSDGLFNMVVVLHKTLLHEGAMNRDKLLALVAPASVSEDRKMASSSLNRWTDLGLFEESDGNVRISSALPAPREKAKAEASLPSTMRRLVLAHANNANFWDAEGSASADFTRAVAWMLAQDVYRCSLVGHKDAAELENDQIAVPDRTLFQNDTRWPGFKAWAPFLGFGIISLYPGRGAFQIDPTVAVRDSMDAVFAAGDQLAIADFMSSLAETLPVIDGGHYRREVESQLNPRHWESAKEQEISTSLSRALIRLREAGLLRLENRSDSPA